MSSPLPPARSARPLRPAPAMTREERRAEQRFLRRLIWTIVGLQLAGGVVSCGMFVRVGGCAPRPRVVEGPAPSPPVAPRR